LPLRVALVIGLLIAASAQLLAFPIAGAGHGWMQPLFFSPALFVVYPILVVRLSAPKELPWPGIEVLLVGAGIALDLLLVRATEAEGMTYFRGVLASPPLPHLWLLLWLLWQALALMLVVRRIFRSSPD
jgi:hypothetical protein